ncbi:MAG TPA: cytochrome b [Caldimonas sp.]|jgi:cytochrome b561|nr:cytochrome b [Caldimonas sp.]HEX2540215.1 cytochrome b [Caldimonas sp.]
MSARQSAEAMVVPRYDRVATWLHWLIGVALLGQIAFGFLLDTIAPRGTPARAPTINLHKSFGIVLGLLVLARLAWRVRQGVPPWPASFSPLQRRAAELGHRALYACMLLMPVSGYIASNFSKYGVRFFGTPLPPWGPESAAVYAFFNGLHVGTAYVFTALVAGHVAVAFRHAMVDPPVGRGRMSRLA